MKDWKRKVVRVGSELADVVVHLNKPTVVGMIAVASRALNTLDEITAKNPDDYFVGDEWSQIQVGFNATLLGVGKATGMLTKVDLGASAGPGGKVWTGEVYGVECGFLEHDGWIDGVHVKGEPDTAAVQAAFGRLVWEVFGRSVVLMPTMAGDTIRADVDKNHHPSETGQKIYERIKKFHDKGYTRSVLLHGPSGTGKSHLMRYVGSLAGGLALRIRTRDLHNLRDISRALLLLRPSVVLIDDLDRAENPSQVLSEVEELKDCASLFMCSVNDFTKLDPACLRVGRFDEFIEVETLDDGVVNRLIGNVPKEVGDQLRALPIAWIDEFHRLREVLGEDEAIAEVQKLRARTEEIQGLMESKSDDEPKEPCTKKHA